ncbi:thiamine phosphate synthase [Kineococcus indalonis]|uniref:thiamine phosphate synthase n=1 Tax=Kineococcus indalonis TaxID=2696566 RepID=UPI001412EC49|nr:thiamine phosphate synthase [Kineococcus indalonis]NAZ86676.1 thiamine phosphate synthase [Kineococcus indalonis]
MSAPRRPFDPSLYLVTDTALCGARGVPAVVGEAVAGGATAVQVRGKGVGDRELLALVRAVQEVLRGTGVPVIVDDAVDVALVAGADGVHLGQSDLPAEDARRLLGPGPLLGLSVSSAREVLAAPAGVVDHFGVGPVRATATKTDAAAPLGLDGVREVVRAAAGTPCVAIGGITAADLAGLRAAGAAGACVVSAVCAAPDPRAAAAQLRSAWDAAGPGARGAAGEGAR